MKKIYPILLLLIALAQYSYAQVITFDKTINVLGRTELADVEQTSDGGYAAIGHSEWRKIVVIRYNQFGDTLWVKVIGNTNYVFGTSIKQTSDGGFIISGSGLNISKKAFLAKLNANGNILWQREFGSGGVIEPFSSVKQHADGTYTALGLIKVASIDYFYLVKLNALGDTIWTKKYGAPQGNIDFGNELTLTSDGGYFIAGGLENMHKYEMYLIKTNHQGITQWTKHFTQLSGRSGIQTTDGGYMLAAMRTDTSRNNNFRSALIKLNQLGDTVWTKTYPGFGANSVIQTADGGYAFTGSIFTGPFYFNLFYCQDLLAVKTDAAGNMRYMRTFGDTLDDVGNKIRQTADGGFIIAGLKDWIFNGGVVTFPLAGPDKGLLYKFNFTAQDAVLSSPKEKDLAKNVSLQIYPNPASSQYTVKITGKFLGVPLRIKVISALGAEVEARKVLNSEIVLNRDNQPAGLYLVQLINEENGKVLTTQKLLFK